MPQDNSLEFTSCILYLYIVWVIGKLSNLCNIVRIYANWIHWYFHVWAVFVVVVVSPFKSYIQIVVLYFEGLLWTFLVYMPVLFWVTFVISGSSAIHDACSEFNITQFQTERGRFQEHLAGIFVRKFDILHTDVNDVAQQACMQLEKSRSQLT